MHSLTFFSCERPTNPAPVVSPGSGVNNGAMVGDAALVPAVGGPSTSTLNPLPTAVVGYLCMDGRQLAAQLHIFVRLLLTKPGLLMHAVGIVVGAVFWTLARIPPIRSFLRRTRGAALFLTTVKSRGTVRLASGDAAAPPLIDPNYLSHSDDQKAILECFRRFQRATRETRTGKACIGREIMPGAM